MRNDGGDDEGLDTTHIAVWDFNADKLDEEKYINMLTAEDLNNARHIHYHMTEEIL